jgi:hypothetical protein
MAKKHNNYVGEAKAKFYADNRCQFTRTYTSGGFFYTNDGEKKINEKTFQKIKQFLKPIR